MTIEPVNSEQLISLIGDSRKYTLHSHTEFCDGRAQMEAFARKAVEMGFDFYGFSPHSPLPVVSGCNMLAGKVGCYLEEVDNIRRRHGDHVRFLASMEIDYLGEQWGPSHPFFQSLPLDYRIGSVHFVPTRDNEPIDVDGSPERFAMRMNTKFNRDIRYVVEKFYEHSIMMVQQGGFEIIGHFDKIGENSSRFAPGIENESWYMSLVDELIDNIIAKKIIVEINTKVYAERGRLFPAVRYWKKLIDNNVPLVVNSDAHVPALIDASRQEVFDMLDSVKKAGTGC
ncbi:MAG: histidinol-phosphatase [Muribaculaceae bacterium]|nr:histidinol-phosphatase [Muribaculaceae bacterium]